MNTNNKVHEGSLLVERILNSRKKRGYQGFCATGPRGSGKSVFCLKIGKDIYKTLYNCNDREAYDLALKNFVFTIPEVVIKLQEATSTNSVIPLLNWDDVSVHASSLHYFEDISEVNTLKSIVETIRTGCSSMGLNCVDRSSLLKCLVKSDDLIVEIHPASTGGYDRTARVYHIHRLPSGKQYYYKQFEDEFSCWIPDYVYEIYYDRRKKYLSESLKRMAEKNANHDVNDRYTKLKKQLEQMEIDKRVFRLKEKGIEIKE